MTTTCQIDSVPRGDESAPRRAHRATGRPRGGKRPGAGRKPDPERAAQLATWRGSVRTFDRARRVWRYSPTLLELVRIRYVTLTVADKAITVALRALDAGLMLPDTPVVREIVAAHARAPRDPAPVAHVRARVRLKGDEMLADVRRRAAKVVADERRAVRAREAEVVAQWRETTGA